MKINAVHLFGNRYQDSAFDLMYYVHMYSMQYNFT